jgi:hypothetical protein
MSTLFDLYIMMNNPYIWAYIYHFYYIVAFLPRARRVEPQKQPILSNIRTKNGTVELCNPLATAR